MAWGFRQPDITRNNGGKDLAGKMPPHLLGHLSRENNFESLALETVRAALRASDIPDEAFALSIAHRDRIGEMFEID